LGHFLRCDSSSLIKLYSDLFYSSIIKFLVIDGNGGIGIFYMFVGLPFTSIAFMKLLDLRAWRIMRTNYKNFKRDEEVY